MKKVSHKEIIKMQNLAKDFMIGGVLIPLFKGDGSTKEINLEQNICQYDLYKLKNDHTGIESAEYILPNQRVMQAMFAIRHKWSLSYAVLCRDKKGKVYYVQQRTLVVDRQCNYEELEQYLSKSMIDAFKAANPEYRLTFCYCYIPDGEHYANEFHFNAMIHARNVLSKLHSKWEYHNLKEIEWYNPDSLIDFNYWFFNQQMDVKKEYVPLIETSSLYVEELEEVEVYGNISQLHPIMPIIPERYRSTENEGSYLTIKTEDDFAKYRKLMEQLKGKASITQQKTKI